ncbi:MAG: hypothetical protein MJ094_00420 [Saccharofermentans sp.]|nr:hypothetical protein [Saccharofermentans sp.]
MRKLIGSIISVSICASVLFTACTSNTGEGTLPSDSSVATQAMGDLTYTIETLNLSGQNTSTVYGSQLPGYLNHQYYFEGQPVSLTESNFYFIDTFTDFTQYAGYYYPATSEGFIDLSAPIETTGGTDEINQYSTYGDFYVSYAEEMLESALIINKLAAEDGITLSDETQAEIDSVMNNISSSGAAPAGLSVDEYLSIYYGEGTTEESFRATIERYYIADVYTQAWIDSYEFDESEITVPNIRYALFADMEGTPESLAAAQEAADALYAEADGNLDTFAVEGALAYTNGTCYQYGEIPTPNDGSIDAVFTEWAWDESREVGDIDVIYTENFGYFVVGYVGTTEVDDATKDQIAVAALSHEISDAIDNNTYNFYTDIAFEPAPTVPEISYDDMTIPTQTSAPVEGQVGGMTGSKALDIVLIIFAAVGGVAIIGLAVVGAMSFTKNNKQDSTKKSTKEKSNGDN